MVKRSLVNGSQRIELTGWSAARLDWYKAQGCFTEIIRYQTRLFVPIEGAAGVGYRLGAGFDLPRNRKGRIMSIIGLIVSVLWLILYIILFVYAVNGIVDGTIPTPTPAATIRHTASKLRT